MIRVLDAPTSALEYSRLAPAELVERIEARKRELNAVILGHNYQRVEIQAVSDFLGDSLGLSQEAAKTDADVIVFCGVHFMAETAKVLSPEKTVLMPDARAGCPMADFVTADSLRLLKANFPGAPVISYVNSTAEVKAESDICCTSSNAVEVAASFPVDQTLLFVPDRNLARYTAEKTGRPFLTTSELMDPSAIAPGTIVAWDGYCYVHDDLVLDELAAARSRYPNAKVVIHPEARRELLEQADYVTSTSAMVQIAGKHDELIIGTERGLIDRLRAEFPEKTLIPLSGAAICGNMKLNTLAKLAWSLDTMKHEVVLDEGIRLRAERALRRMLEIAGGWRAPTAEEEAIETDGLRATDCGCA
ncbi:MAG: quinolinate synthase [Gemmatimonadota bacterium]|jgi:quinolinate synthase|nr:quinolinate synthase [Gemmatimonadota bacterium]